MKFILKFAALSSSLLQRNFVDAANDNAAIEIHNPWTAFQQCSHGDKKWRICRGDYFPKWYCPTVLEYSASHVEDIGPCFTCPDAESDCEKVVSEFLTSHNISEEAIYDDDWGYNIADELVSSCQDMCEAGTKGDACWSANNEWDHGDSCASGSHFCDFASDEEFAMNISGTCKACPSDPNECYQDGFVTSIEGKRNCVGCTLDCKEKGTSRLTVNGKEIPSYPVYRAIQKSYQNASGPLIDCSKMKLEGEDRCPGAEGHVCIVNNIILGKSEVGKFHWELSKVAESSGCVAIAIILTEQNYPKNVHGLRELAIPFVFVLSEEDRNQWLKSVHNSVAQVEVQLFGSTCYSASINCNVNLPCGEGEYCDYSDVVVDGEYTEGYCTLCPTFENGEPDPAGCFFDRNYYNDTTLSRKTAVVVESCANACGATLVSDACKFCPSKISALDFGVKDKADQCYFCPDNDVQYPDKFVPLFGENITCWMIQTFFKRMEVDKDSPNCRLVQSMNYLCGCSGTGYVGANTHRKQVVLVWLPRVAAMLSMAGSLFIIYDTLRTHQKRAKLMNQLLSTLSMFDIMGSTAYALTTLPTPESDELYGAKGNQQTCKAQGFFIQIGTIACFLNVSLAFYYFLTIKYGWTEEMWKRRHATFILVIPPIVVGLVFAFVGLPYYYNVRVWCNNSAKWWPEIPVILAIIAATGIMGTLCHHVYKIETRTAQYTDIDASLSLKVFKQSCWFVFAFYITWVPYLVLQFMLSSGQGYDNYGLVLTAATLVPLQGFWNNFVYIRPRYLSKMLAHVISSFRRVSSFFQRRSKADATEQSAVDSLQQPRPHDQLQVLHVCGNAVMSSLDDDCNSANARSENEIDNKTLDATQRDILDSKSDNEDRGDIKGSSCLDENSSKVEKESFGNDKPLRVSMNNNIEVDRAVAYDVDGKL